jgi:hypothetical protein
VLVSDLQVERAAVAVTEMSLARCTGLATAVPAADHDVDLMAYQAAPFRVAKIKVKGLRDGLTVLRWCCPMPVIVSYVLDPLGVADVVLLTGEQAWNLAVDYVARSGDTGDDYPDNDYYRWSHRPELLTAMLREHRAGPRRWRELFDQTATPAPSGNQGDR